MKRLLVFLLFVVTSVIASGQVPVVGTTIDAKTGFRQNGVAPSNHTLCGNGTNYVDSSAACGILFYQAISINGGSALTQRGFINFSSFFTGTDTSPSTTIDAAHVGANKTCSNPSSMTVDGYGRTTACSNGVNQHLTIIGSKGSASCDPGGAGSFAVCNDTITWNQAFPDTAYTATCSLQSPITSSGSATMNIYPHAASSTTTLTVSVQNMGSASSVTANDIVCIGQEL